MWTWNPSHPKTAVSAAASPRSSALWAAEGKLSAPLFISSGSQQHIVLKLSAPLLLRPPLPESSMEKMKRFKRRLSQTLRGSQTIDESLSELAEQMTIEENGLKDSGTLSFFFSCFFRSSFCISSLVTQQNMHHLSHTEQTLFYKIKSWD